MDEESFGFLSLKRIHLMEKFNCDNGKSCNEGKKCKQLDIVKLTAYGLRPRCFCAIHRAKLYMEDDGTITQEME